MARLVLWDIDHTLIDTRGVGRELSAAAFERTTGKPMKTQAKIDGITEPVIFRETAKLHDLVADRSDFERFARPDGRRVDDRRGPVHLAPGTEFVQHRPVQPAPQARLGPRREPAMRRRGRRTERRRQMPPGATAGQHVHHGSEHGPLITRSGPAALRTGIERRQ